MVDEYEGFGKYYFFDHFAVGEEATIRSGGGRVRRISPAGENVLGPSDEASIGCPRRRSVERSSTWSKK